MGSQEKAQHSEQATTSAQPNIVFLLFDDVGYSDLAIFGGEVETPTIERIVSEGVVVKRFYTAARCSPTRAGILSGHYPHDVGMADLANGPRYKTQFSAYQGQMPVDVPLLSEILQKAGYTTYLQGKWHLGKVPGLEVSNIPAPNLRGFDHFFGVEGGQANPYPSIYAASPYRHNTTYLPRKNDWYSISGLNDAMLAQLELQFAQQPASPFFTFITSQAPHFPLAAPKTLIEKYDEIYAAPAEELWEARIEGVRENGLFPAGATPHPLKLTAKTRQRMQQYMAKRAAMIESADSALGKLIALLESTNKLDNTIILVASDNGAGHVTSYLSNAPFEGFKGQLQEGGVLSTLAVRWPNGNILSNEMSEGVASYLDLMPTLLQAAKVPHPTPNAASGPLPGRNIMPMLQGSPQPPPEYLFWDLYGRFSVIHQGRWKLMGNTARDAPLERGNAKLKLRLVDLHLDPAETRNVAQAHPERVESLLAHYEQWASEKNAVPYSKVLDAYRKYDEK